MKQQSMNDKPVKPWYKRRLFWTAVIAAAAATFDLTIGEQSALIEVVMLIIGAV